MLIPTSLPPSAAAGTGAAADICKSSDVPAQKIPVDIFMMVDQSLSMVAIDASGMTRWQSVIGALTQFVQSPESAGISIGLQYFGLGTGGGSCAPEDYMPAEVEIGALPQNSAALTSSFSAHAPSTVTPTAPALQGAIAHARAHKLANPTHSVIVLLVTDGEPDACGLLPETVSAAAQGLMSAPLVETYVLGVGDKLDALNQIAAAGGTERAYIVDATQDVSKLVLMALTKIRSAATLPCELLIPQPDPGMPLELDKVNVAFTPPGGASTFIGHSDDPAACATAPMAWRYDAPVAPTKILLCDGACKAVATSAGSITISLKCPTIDLK